MKKQLKLFLFLLTAVTLFAIMAVISASALSTEQGTNPYKITKTDGTTAYAATMKEAVTNAKDGSTIYLVADASSEATSSVTMSKTLTLVGNGYTITTNSNAWISVQPGGNLTLQNCDFIVGENTKNQFTIAVGGDGEASLTLKGTNTFTFDANGSGKLSGNYLIYLNNPKATVNIESGTTIYQIGHGYGIYANAVKTLRANGLTVTNVMDGVTYSVYSGAICLRGGEAVLSDCTIMQNATSGAALICENGASMHLVDCNVTGARAISNANHTGASGGKVYVYSGTYQSTKVAVLTVRYETTGAEFYIYGGTFAGGECVINFEKEGGTANIYGGTFSNTGSVVGMSVASTLNIDQRSTQFEGVTYGGSVVLAVTGSGSFLNATAPEASITIKSGKFTATETATLFAVSGGTVSVSGGEFITEDSATAFAVSAGALNISGGTFSALDKSLSVNVKDSSLTVSGGIFNTNGFASAFFITGGETRITSGQFNCSGTYVMDVVVVDGKDSFEISGGVFTLENSSAIGGAILRTGVRVTPQHDVNQFYDPTDIYYFSSADILLSGGTFIDKRATNNQVIDATLGTSRIVISGTVLLSQYRKCYFVDVNDSIGSDIPLLADSPVCIYGSKEYYFYAASKQEDAYAPVTNADAQVALADSYEGIRFTSYIPAKVALALPQGATFGTLIAPADYVARAGGFTHALLDTLSSSAGIKTTYVDIKADKSILHHADGSISFCGVLSNLKEANYKRSFAAVSYVCVNGTYHYSEYDVADHVRSMAVIAKREYTNVVDTLDADHLTRSLYNNSKWSAYSESQQNRLLAYSGYTHTLTAETFTPCVKITVGTDASANLKAAAAALKATLKGLGYSTTAGTPILVGNTGEAETAQALSEIEGHGYYIGVINNKLVIVGTTNLLTMQALSVFEKEHLAAAGADGSLILWEDIASNKQMVSLSSDTAFVFQRTRDGNVFDPYSNEAQIRNMNPNSEVSFNSSKNHLYNYEDNPAAVDYPVAAALEIGTALHGDGYNYYYVPDDLDDGIYGIHVGVTDKALTTLLSGKDLGYYGYAIEGGNVIISSFDDATLRLAKKMFLDDLADFAADGTYMIPTDYSFEKGKDDGFTGAFYNYSNDATVQAGANVLANELSSLVTDFPRPENLQLTGAVTVGNNSLELVYENATLLNYSEYCALLEENGYKAYIENRYVSGNAFVTYYNSQNNVTLHVMYNAYLYGESETLDTGTTLSEMFTPTLRVVAAEVDGTQVRLLPEEFLRIPTYTKVIDSKITVVQLNSFGYCYVYTLEDGRFVVLDGGSFNEDARDNLYRVLTELYTDIHKKAPTADNPIEIAAWYFTHTHGDHRGMVANFINTYCNVKDAYGKYKSLVVMDCIISNHPSNDQSYNAQDNSMSPIYYLGTSKWHTSNGVAIPYYKVHTGQRFFISNLEFEVMYTTEDLYPWATIFYNNTSAVIRLTSHNTNGDGTIISGSTSTSNMVLGDVMARGSMVMRATWGDYLKSDMVVCAHHCQNGCEGDLYELIDAQIVWLTQSSEKINTIFFGSSNFSPQNRKLLENTHWLYMIGGRPATVETGAYYNVTVTMGEDGVAGLYEGGDEEFLAGLCVVAGGTAGELSFGTGQYTGTEDETYSGNRLLINRDNFDVPMPPYEEPQATVPTVEDTFDSDIFDLKTAFGIVA